MGLSIVRSALAVGAIFAVSTLASPAAEACGGLFCSIPPTEVPTAPEPVDQTAERIIFEVFEDTVTAHVQVSYFGPASDFAWIVPVPEGTTVAESSAGLFDTVASGSAMNVVLPAAEQCPAPVGSGGGRGPAFGCTADAASATAEGGDGVRSPDGMSPVTVYASGATENYEYSIIGAARASDLVDWLRVNRFNVSDNMTPVMQPYSDEGMQYLAVKLREGREATNIVPLAMTYPGVEPMIPIRLTAVAAQPLMGIQVWIFGDAPYVPTNYAMTEPEDTEIVSDELGNTSYYEWVAREVAESAGRLWIAEYMGENQTGTLRGHDVVSRYYTRMNPGSMTVDPVFAVANNAPPVNSTLDLSWQPTPFTCGGVDMSRVPSACGFNYCGLGAVCSVDNGRVGCLCREGEVAQSITGPDGTRKVTCGPAVNPFGVTAEAGGVGTEFDPCADVVCGLGECVVRGGFPTCDCNTGAIACLEPGGVVCVAATAGAETFGPGAGNEASPTVVASIEQPVRTWYAALVGPMLFAGILLGLRRRAV